MRLSEEVHKEEEWKWWGSKAQERGPTRFYGLALSGGEAMGGFGQESSQTEHSLLSGALDGVALHLLTQL